jgi:hypothetical protein
LGLTKKGAPDGVPFLSIGVRAVRAIFASDFHTRHQCTGDRVGPIDELSPVQLGQFQRQVTKVEHLQIMKAQMVTSLARAPGTLREDRDRVDGRAVAFQGAREIHMHPCRKMAGILSLVFGMHNEPGLALQRANASHQVLLSRLVAR